jgi:hypothetical protein
MLNKISWNELDELEAEDGIEILNAGKVMYTRMLDNNDEGLPFNAPESIAHFLADGMVVVFLPRGYSNGLITGHIGTGIKYVHLFSFYGIPYNVIGLSNGHWIVDGMEGEFCSSENAAYRAKKAVHAKMYYREEVYAEEGPCVVYAMPVRGFVWEVFKSTSFGKPQSVGFANDWGEACGAVTREAEDYASYATVLKRVKSDV